MNLGSVEGGIVTGDELVEDVRTRTAEAERPLESKRRGRSMRTSKECQTLSLV